MAYLFIEDFSKGIDLRKQALTASPGSLRQLENGVVTSGGEIEKRLKFTSLGTLPANTHGLAYKDNFVWVFGNGNAPGGMPTYAKYHKLNGGTIDKVLDVQVFNNKFYVVARLTNGDTEHYYNGSVVADSGAQGHVVHAHRSKLYAVEKENLRFSAVLDPTKWTSGTGAGLIDVTTQDADATILVGLEKYYSNVAVFGRSTIQIWFLDPDPNNDVLIETLGNIGLVAPRGLARYSNGNVLFLADSGIRSLRARDASNSAGLNDVGSPVDAVVADLRATLTRDEVDEIRGLVDPLSGRFWLTWGDKALVYTTFPNSKVSAWSMFDMGVRVTDAISANSRVVFRSGDGLFIYGGVEQGVNPFDPTVGTNIYSNTAPRQIGPNDPFDTRDEYDNTSMLIETPLMSASDPARVKNWTGIDVTVQGDWDVYVNETTGYDPQWTKVAVINSATWDNGRIPLDSHSTHLSVRMVSKNDGFASLSNMAIHYEGGETS